MKKALISLLFVLSGLICLGQNVENGDPIKIQGTYQIQVINSRNEPFIPANIEEIVKKNRKKDQIVYYKIADDVRVLILPEVTINSTDFKPLDQIAHIEEK